MGEKLKYRLPEEDTVEQIKKILEQQPREKLAWAWQNFIKRYKNGVELNICIKKLYKELQENLPPRHNLQSVLAHGRPGESITNEDIELNISELERYLNGELAIPTSKIYQLFPEVNLAVAMEPINKFLELAKTKGELFRQVSTKLKKIKDPKEREEISKEIESANREYLTPNQSAEIKIVDAKKFIQTLQDLERRIDSILENQKK